MTIPAEAVVAINGRTLAPVPLVARVEYVVPANALLSAIDGTPLLSAINGAILTSARN